MAGIMPYVWVAIAVVMAVAEVSTTQLVSVWFVIGAVVCAVASATFLYDAVFWQVVLFLAVPAICLIVTRPLVRKLKKKSIEKTNSDKYIGKIGKVVSDIGHNTYTGQVEVEGSKWTAISLDNTVIKAGTTVKVEQIQGVKLIVTPVEN